MADYAETIKQSVSMAEVLDKYGFETVKNKMCCPFHNEKTASFTIYKTNTYYCFGCGASGDVVKFIMEYFKIDFKTAIERIDTDFNLMLSNKPTLTRKRKLDKRLAQIKAEREAERQQQDYADTVYWECFDRLDILERLIEKCKPKSPEEEPNAAFLFALKNIESAKHYLDCAENERRLAYDRRAEHINA